MWTALLLPLLWHCGYSILIVVARMFSSASMCDVQKG